MGKHFSPAEQDNIQKWKGGGWTTPQIQERFAKDRARVGCRPNVQTSERQNVRTSERPNV